MNVLGCGRLNRKRRHLANLQWLRYCSALSFLCRYNSLAVRFVCIEWKVKALVSHWLFHRPALAFYCNAWRSKCARALDCNFMDVSVNFAGSSVRVPFFAAYMRDPLKIDIQAIAQKELVRAWSWFWFSAHSKRKWHATGANDTQRLTVGGKTLFRLDTFLPWHFIVSSESKRARRSNRNWDQSHRYSRRFFARLHLHWPIQM